MFKTARPLWQIMIPSQPARCCLGSPFMTTFVRSWLLGLVLSVATMAQAAVNVDGIAFEDTMSLQGQTLQLNGAGKRVRIIVDVYAMGLYTVQASQDPSVLIKAGGPKNIRIVMMRNLDGEDFAEALVKGFKSNHNADELSAMQARLDELSGAMRAFGQIKKGTVVDIHMLPETGLRVLVNGQARTATIPGTDFQAGILRIWLGASAVDKDLKSDLLKRP